MFKIFVALACVAVATGQGVPDQGTITIGGSVSYFSDKKCSSDDGDILSVSGICQPQRTNIYGKPGVLFATVLGAGGKVWGAGAATQEECIDQLEVVVTGAGSTEKQCISIPECHYRQEYFHGSFQSVQNQCKRKYPKGSGLATITNPTQNAEAQRECAKNNNQRGCYLGLYQGDQRGTNNTADDDWRWVDGNSVTHYTNWAPGQPDDNKGNDETWGMLNTNPDWGASGQWHDACSVQGECTKLGKKESILALCQDCSEDSGVYVKLDSNQPCQHDNEQSAKKESKAVPTKIMPEKISIDLSKIGHNLGNFTGFQVRTEVQFGGTIQIFSDRMCSQGMETPAPVNGFCSHETHIGDWVGSALIGCVQGGKVALGSFGQSTQEPPIQDEANDKCLSAIATGRSSSRVQGQGVWAGQPGQCLAIPNTDCDAEKKGMQSCYAKMMCPAKPC